MMISSAERQYVQLIELIRTHGFEAHPTKGTTLSIFGGSIIMRPEEVPLLIGRKIYTDGLVGELRAFISNEATVKGFESYGCNFWGAWGNEDGTLDVDYARLLHNFNGVNQLERLIDNLKNKPHSRKHVISLWDPSSEAKQVPCVLSYQWSVQGKKLDMIWTQRSADVMIGLASDMFSAWLFNQLIAKTVGLEPGTVTINIGDAHIYKDHLTGMYDYIDCVWRCENEKTPKVHLVGDIYDFGFKLEDYAPGKTIKFDLKV
ncbi:MAG: hypothetical protein DRP93_08275 [Candidatus Neomarinimicrobiota bacterium]|nr:MAG: hypothetical protein DRP93_08275 [Candidatus Neomarinimicrobiota bacterium]